MSDAHQGGDLSQLAVNGTSIPNDAGKQNLIPSVPAPDQDASSSVYKQNDPGAASLAGAASNATDLPRQPKDIGAASEVVTGTGDQLPAQTESKRLHLGANDPLSKGHDRYDKHSRQKESDFERYQGEGAGAAPAPGEEEDSQDAIRDRLGANTSDSADPSTHKPIKPHKGRARGSPGTPETGLAPTKVLGGFEELVPKLREPSPPPPHQLVYHEDLYGDRNSEEDTDGGGASCELESSGIKEPVQARAKAKKARSVAKAICARPATQTHPMDDSDSMTSHHDFVKELQEAAGAKRDGRVPPGSPTETARHVRRPAASTSSSIRAASPEVILQGSQETARPPSLSTRETPKSTLTKHRRYGMFSTAHVSPVEGNREAESPSPTSHKRANIGRPSKRRRELGIGVMELKDRPARSRYYLRSRSGSSPAVEELELGKRKRYNYRARAAPSQPKATVRTKARASRVKKRRKQKLVRHYAIEASGVCHEESEPVREDGDGRPSHRIVEMVLIEKSHQSGWLISCTDKDLVRDRRTDNRRKKMGVTILNMSSSL